MGVDSIYWSETKENDKVRDGGVRDNFQISLWSSWLDECVISLRQGITDRKIVWGGNGKFSYRHVVWKLPSDSQLKRSAGSWVQRSEGENHGGGTGAEEMTEHVPWELRRVR